MKISTYEDISCELMSSFSKISFCIGIKTHFPKTALLKTNSLYGREEEKGVEMNQTVQ